jgi:YD repeat-containing protein
VQAARYDGNGNVIALTNFTRPIVSNNPTDADIAAFIAGAANAMSTDGNVRMSYDAANRLVATATAQVTLGSGEREWSIVAQEYDNNGNVIARRSYATKLLATEVTATGLTTFVTDAAKKSLNDAQTRFVYDNANRVTAAAVAQGNDKWAVTANAFDKAGNVIRRTAYATPLTPSTLAANPTPANYATWISGVQANGALDQVTRIAYDGANRPVVTIDAAGAVTRRVYDTRGNVVQHIAYETPSTLIGEPAVDYVPKIDDEVRSSRTIYDLDNRPVYQVDAHGFVTESRYDSLGNVVATARFERMIALSQLSATTTPAQLKTLLGNSSANDRVQRTVFDKAGRPSFTIDAAGYFKEYRYDALGRLSKTLEYGTVATYGTGNPEKDAPIPTQAQLDAARVKSYVYDAQGNLLSCTDADGTESNVYDGLGNRTSFTNKRGFTWDYQYDAAGRMVLEKAPAAEVNTSTVSVGADGKTNYLLGSPLQVRLETVIKYDALGNITDRIEAANRLSDPASPITPRTTSYAYDAAGRQVKITFEKVAVYNENENALANNGLQSDGTRGLATRADLAEANLTVETTYDMLGNAISNKDVGGKISYKIYDKLGQVRYDIDAAKYVTGYERNAYGEVTKLTRYAKPTTAEGTATVTEDDLANRSVRTEYNKLGQVVKVVEPGVHVYDQTELDPLDVKNGYSISARTTDWTYNAFGDAIKQSVYGADYALGSRYGVQTSLSHDTHFSYDRRGMQRTVFSVLSSANAAAGAEPADHTGYITALEYDAYGNLNNRREYANTVTLTKDAIAGGNFSIPAANAENDREVRYAYDAFNRKTVEQTMNVAVTASNGVTTRDSSAIVTQYDQLGNVVRTYDALSNVTNTFYDALGRVTAVAITHSGAQANDVAPLTEFKRDAYGNVLMRIEYANGAAPLTGGAPVAKAVDADNDRRTGTVFDIHGHALQTVDALGNSSYSSFDAYGHIAKVWQRVSGIDGAQIMFQVTRYDALGRVVKVETADVHNAAAGALPTALAIHSTGYNAFGEVISRGITDSANVVETPYMSADYDNAGNVWRTNEGGIYKVNLFDAFGNVTAQIRSTSDAASNPLAGTAFDSGDDVVNLADLLRTNTRYDRLGRAVDVRQVMETKLYVLAKDANDNWERTLYRDGTVPKDALIVVGGPGDEGKTITVLHKLVGATAWTNMSALRVQTIDNYVVFSTAGLPEGKYEYQVSVEGAGEAKYERTIGTLETKSIESTSKNEQIVRLYTLLLNRAVDATGMDYWIDSENNGMPLAEIAKQLFISDEAKARFQYKTATQVMEMLFDSLGKAKTPAELSKWADRFNNQLAGDNRGQTIVDLMTQTLVVPNTDAARLLVSRSAAVMTYLIDYRGGNVATATAIYTAATTDLAATLTNARALGRLEQTTTQIVQAYITLFGRAPDSAGMAYWQARLSTGIATDLLVTELLNSDEARNPLLYPTLPEAQYRSQLVIRTHQIMLGRVPTAQEQADWLAKLNGSPATPAISIGMYVLMLADKVASYVGTDAALLNEKVQFNDRVAIGLTFSTLTADANLPLDLQGAAGKAVIDAVTSADTAKHAAEAAVAKLTAAVTLASALKTATLAASAATPYEEMRLRISRLYMVLLNRAPEASGMAKRMDQLASGTSYENIATEMLSATEASGLAGLSNADFVRRLYENALGTLPSSVAIAAEMATHVQTLNGAGRGVVAAQIADSILSFGAQSAEEATLKARYIEKAAVGVAFAVDLSSNDAAIAKETLRQVNISGISVAIQYAHDAVQAALKAAAKVASDAGAVVKLALSATANAAAASLAADNALATANLGLSTNPSAALRLEIMQMFVAILGRSTVDYASLDFFVANIAAAPQLKIAEQLITSANEGTVIFGGKSDAQFVNIILTNILGAGTDFQAIAAKWTGILTARGSKTLPLAQAEVARGILAEVLSYTNTAPTDATKLYLSARKAFQVKVAAAVADVAAKSATAAQSAASLQATRQAEYNSLSQSLQGLQKTKEDTETAKNTAITNMNSALTNAENTYSDHTATERLEIDRLFATLLGRSTVSLTEVNYYVQTGLSGPAIAEAMMSSPEAGGSYPTEKTALVTKLYGAILGRSAIASEVNYWATQTAGMSRGQTAIAMLNSYLGFSDSTPAMLATKTIFDGRIQSILDAQANTATSLYDTAYSTYLNAYYAKDNAETALVAANADLRAKLAAYEAAVAAATDAPTILSNQSLVAEITRVYVGLRGGADLAGVAYWMRVWGSSSRSMLISELLGSFPSDNEAFIRQMYQSVYQREATTAELSYWMGALNAHGRVQFASDMLNGSDAGLNARASSATHDIIYAAADLIATWNVASAQYDTARATVTQAQSTFNSAEAYFNQVEPKVVPAQQLKLSAVELAYAHKTVPLADAAYAAYSQAALNLNVANQRMVDLKKLIDAGTQLANSAPANNAAGAIANAYVLKADADVQVASAYIGHAKLTPSERYVKEVTQLFTVLLNRRPDVIELMIWTTARTGGSTMAQIAGEISRSSDPRDMERISVSNDAFVKGLFLYGLGKTLPSQDAGVKYWSDLLPPVGTMERSELAVQWINSFDKSITTDNIIFANRTNTALQGVIDEAAMITLLPDLTPLISLADSRGLTAAASYDAAAALAASSTAARNATTLTRLFLAIFNRTPDAAGMQFWFTSMNSGATDVQVAQGLLSGIEGLARYPASMNDSAFLDKIFVDTLGRAPVQADYDKYLGIISSSSRAAMVAALVKDVAYASGGNLLQLASRNLFNSKVITALKDVLPALTTNQQVLSSALDSGVAIVAANPIDRHADPISNGIESTLQGGTATASAARWNGIDLLKLDRWGNTISVADLRNPAWKTEYKYNVNNQIVMVMQPSVLDGISGNWVQPAVNYGYDKLGRVVKIDSNGNVNQTEYDGNGNVATEIHADGGRVNNSYDAFGNRLRSARTRGTSYADIVTTYTYDKLSQLTSTSTGPVDVFFAEDFQGDKAMLANPTDTNKVLTDRYEYDEAGRRTKSTNAAGNAISTAYDLAGNVIKATNPLGYMTLTSFDSFGHKLSETNALGTTMRWVVDSVGKMSSHTDLSGTIISYAYNGLNQVTSKTSTARADVGAGLNKQEILYSYENGLLTRIEDRATGTTTTYAYDLAGNRVMEKTSAKLGEGPATVIQNNRISYDQLGRMSRVTDSRFDVIFTYDKNGNRTLVDTTYINSTGGQTNVKAYNKFDKMNRVVISNGDLSNGNIISGTNGHAIIYDLAGNRLSDTYRYKDQNGNPLVTSESFTYDNAGRLSYVYRDGIAINYRVYDAASRVVREGAVNAWDADKLKEFGISADYRTYSYDAAGQLARLKYRTLTGQPLDDIYYRSIVENPTAGYDAIGRLIGYSVIPKSGVGKTFYTTTFAGFDSYKEASTTGRMDGSSPTTSLTKYDVNGNVVSVSDGGATTRDRSYINDADGHVLLKTQNGKTTFTLVANGEVLGDTSAETSGIGFANTYESATSGANTAAPSIYTTQAGDTLQNIAKAVWGDSRLWYLIADANGRTGLEPIVPGEIIKIPSRVNTVHSDSTTFKPYSISEAIGDTKPTLPEPPAGKKGCGIIGQIIMVVVAVVVTYITAGAASGAMGTMLGYAFGAAVGSVASQGIGLAIGAIDKFSWKSVALAAVASGIGAGIAQAAQVGGALNTVAGGTLAGEGWTAVAARAALSNTISQGIGVVTGLQDKFEWRNVAASYAGGAVGQLAGEAAKGSEALKAIFGSGRMMGLAAGTISGFAAGTTAAVMRGGKVAVQQIAADAFGNALGSSLSMAMSNTESQREVGRVNRTFDPNSLIAELKSPPERGAWNFTDYGYESQTPLAQRLGLVPKPEMSLASDFDSGAAEVDGPSTFSSDIVETPNAEHLYVGRANYRRGIDALEVARVSDRAFYRENEFNSSNPLSAVGWHFGGLFNETAYDLADSARGTYRLATNARAQVAAFNNLKYAVKNPTVVAGNVAKGFKEFAAKSTGEQADSIFKLGAGGFASAGAGKIGLFAVKNAASGAATTTRWLAPKAGELLDNYMYRTGNVAYAMEPAVGASSDTLLSATRLRNTPGVATASGDLLPAAGRWLDPSVPTPLPAQVGDALVGQKFNSFDDLRSAVWENIGKNPELNNSFSRQNVINMKNGLSPFAPTEFLNESGAFGQSFNLHHIESISNGGAVYDLSNLQIVSPLIHYGIHY